MSFPKDSLYIFLHWEKGHPSNPLLKLLPIYAHQMVAPGIKNKLMNLCESTYWRNPTKRSLRLIPVISRICARSLVTCYYKSFCNLKLQMKRINLMSIKSFMESIPKLYGATRMYLVI